MEHKAAVENHAVERYLLGEMPAEERDAFEEHYFSCVECAEEVRTAAHLRANWDTAGQPKGWSARPQSAGQWWRWPSLIPIAASVLFAGVVWYQAGRQPVVGSLDQFAIHETVRGDAGATVLIPKGAGPALVAFIVPADAPPPPYECTIADSTGKTVGTTTITGPATPEGRILLRRERLHSGLYTITLRSAGAPVAQYSFQLE